MTGNEEKIRQLCATAVADVNLCVVAYSVIEDAPAQEQAALLETFVTGFRNTPTDSSLKLPKLVTKEEELRFSRDYGHLVDEQLSLLTEKGLPEAEFYEQLWDYLSRTPSLPDTKARSWALYNCAIDRQLPYFALDRQGALSVDQEQFQQLIRDLGEKTIGKMEYILNGSFVQKTQQASLLVKLFEEVGSFEQRAVLMALLISHFERERLADLLRMSHRMAGPPPGGFRFPELPEDDE